MKKVVILGGSFDPPHRGHVFIGEHLTQYYDEVWFMPCYGHAHGKNMSAPRHRFNMLLLATYGTLNCPMKFKVVDYEIENKIMLGTYDTIQHIRKDFPNIDFSFAIGVDNALTIHTWENADKLLKEVPFAVIPRDSKSDKYIPDKNSWFYNSPHAYLKDFQSPGYNSTEIRTLLRQHRDEEALAMLPNAQVYNYIKSWGLYAG